MKLTRRPLFYTAVSLAAVLLVPALYRHKGPQVTAPSVRVNLVGITHSLISWSGTNIGLANSQNPRRPVTDLEFMVANVGDQSVWIEQNLSVEQRPWHVSVLSSIMPPQTNLIGKTGRLGPGETRRFSVRCSIPLAAYVGGGTTTGWEVRAICQTGPSEPGSRFVRWLQHQSWSRHLPRAVQNIEVDAYTFSSGWSEVRPSIGHHSPSW